MYFTQYSKCIEITYKKVIKMEDKSNRRRFIKKSAIISLAGTSSIGSVISKPNEVNHEKKIDLLRFAVASDGHFGQPSTAYKMYHRNIVEWLNEEVDNQGLDFCVFNGDIIHDKPEFLPEVKKYFSKLQVPYYTTRGNHDRVTADVWKATFGIDENHYFESGQSAFILCNTSNEAGEYLCADTTFLENALEKNKDKLSVFVFIHISQKKWVDNGIACPKVTNLLESYANVAAIFHGHDHDHHGVMYSGEKPYFFDGHIGGSWGQEYKGYRIVEILNGRNITTYQYNPIAKAKVNSHNYVL